MTILLILLAIVAVSAICLCGYFAGAFVCRLTPGGLRHALQDMGGYLGDSTDQFDRERRARQVSIVMSASGLVALVNVINVGVAATIYWRIAPNINIAWWAFVIIALSAMQLESCMRLRGKVIPASKASKILRLIVRNATILGAALSVGPVFFVPDAQSPAMMVSLVLLLGLAAGGVAALGALPPAAILFTGVLGGPALYLIWSAGGAYDYLAVLSAVFVFTLGAITSGVYSATVKRPSLAAIGREAECAGVGCLAFEDGPAENSLSGAKTSAGALAHS